MSLTVVVPVWKREFHPLRLLWHLDRTAFPHPVIVADGGDNSVLEGVLADKTNLPRLTYDYFKYDDRSITHFSLKMADAISKVKTPYIVNLAEDDFCLPSGLRRAIEFLETNVDYACCGGKVANYVVGSGPPAPSQESVVGNSFGLLDAQPFTNVSENIGETARERIFDQLKDYAYTYVSVCRKDDAQHAFREVAASGITENRLWDLFINAIVLARGKSKFEKSQVHYVRQRGNSITWMDHESADDNSISPPSPPNFYSQVVEERWHRDFAMFASKLADGIAKTDGISLDGLEDAIREIMAGYFQNFEKQASETEAAQSGRSCPKGFAKRRLRSALASLTPPTLRRAVCKAEQRRKLKALGIARRATVDTLRADGADQAYLDTLNAEFDAIEETLTGNGFVNFLRNTAPQCLAEAGTSAV